MVSQSHLHGPGTLDIQLIFKDKRFAGRIKHSTLFDHQYRACTAADVLRTSDMDGDEIP